MRGRNGWGYASALFWPHADDDIHDDVFWGYPCEPLRDYGNGDIHGALFPPSGYYDYGAYTGGRYASRGRGVKPTPDEQPNLDALKNAVAQANQELAANCPSQLPLTPSARLDAVSKRVNIMLKAVDNVHAALDTFYRSLNDEQKAQFNLIDEPRAARR